MAERQAGSPEAEWKEELALSPTERPHNSGGGRSMRMRINKPISVQESPGPFAHSETTKGGTSGYENER